MFFGPTNECLNQGGTGWAFVNTYAKWSEIAGMGAAIHAVCKHHICNAADIGQTKCAANRIVRQLAHCDQHLRVKTLILFR